MGKNRDFEPISGSGIDDWCNVECRKHFDRGIGVITLSGGPFIVTVGEDETQRISESCL